MFVNTKSQHALRAAGLCLAVAGVFALPTASAQESAVVVKDAVSGNLRAATAQEANVLNTNAAAKKTAMRIAPKATMAKYHRSGAAGVRLTDEFLSAATVVRAADGSLVHECVDAAGHANHSHAPHAASSAPTTVTE
jgi:hypothetical protein